MFFFDVLSLNVLTSVEWNFTAVGFYSLNSLYCSFTIENDKKIINRLTSTNFSFKLLYTYSLYLDKENVTRYKFMLLLRAFSSM